MILRVARAQFASQGYDRATVRAIAAEAGVDPAMVHHYFGSKRGLFVAALELPVDPSQLAAELFTAHSAAERPEALLRAFLDLWDDPERRAPLAALIRGAVSSEQGAAMLREFLGSVMLSRIAPLTGLTPLQAGLVGTQLAGLFVMRYLVALEPVAAASAEEVVAAYAPALRAVLAGGD